METFTSQNSAPGLRNSSKSHASAIKLISLKNPAVQTQICWEFLWPRSVKHLKKQIGQCEECGKTESIFPQSGLCVIVICSIVVSGQSTKPQARICCIFKLIKDLFAVTGWQQTDETHPSVPFFKWCVPHLWMVVDSPRLDFFNSKFAFLSIWSFAVSEKKT